MLFENSPLNEDCSRTLTPRVLKGLHAWLEVDGARLLTDRKGRVAWLNDAARALISKSGAVELEANVLTSLPDQAAPRLPELLAEMDGASQVFVAFDGAGVARLLITGQVIQSDAEVLCGLTLRAVQDPPSLSGSVLRQVFGLTIAEQAVVMALMAGANPEVIARCGNQSLETVRTHIRHVYVKMEVNSREAMFSRLCRFLV